jgi:tripartite-type tricarboxylate transporter receptor subunit TctC
MFNRIFAAAAAVLLLALPEQATAQEIRLVVPYAPGGSADSLGRMFADGLAKSGGTPVLVENRAGGGTTIGTAQVANSKDPQQLLLVSSGLVTNPLMSSDLPYKMSDLAPLAMVGAQPLVLFVHKSVPATTLEEFISFAKASPTPVTFGSAGQGSGNHLTTALLASAAGIEYKHVPYKGIANAATDLIAGHIQALFAAKSTVTDMDNARRIAVAHPERLKSLPDLPTFREQGYDVNSSSWYGFLSSSAIPQEKQQSYSEQILAFARTDAGQQAVTGLGIEPNIMDAAAFDAFLKGETAKWGPIIQELGIK